MPPKPTRPKDQVELHVVPQKPSMIPKPRIQPKRLVELKHAPPKPKPGPVTKSKPKWKPWSFRWEVASTCYWLDLSGISHCISPFCPVLTGYVTMLLAIHRIFLFLFCFPPMDCGVWFIGFIVPALSKCTYVRNPHPFLS